MIDAIIRWSVRSRAAVFGLALALSGFGVLAALRMPIDVFPDLSAPTVTGLGEGHGMAPEEMETLVTFPIEAAVNGALGVRRVRSATSVGTSVVWVEFEWGTDIQRARQTVTERLATVADALPAQVEPPLLAPITSIMGEILFLSLVSDRHDPLSLRTTAHTLVRRRLLSVPGVAQVTPIGGEEKQFQLVLSPLRMQAYGVGLADVAAALAETNENTSAGFVIDAGSESVLRGIGRVTSTDDIARTLVRLTDGGPVTVGDLGHVRLGAAIRRGAAASSTRGPDWEPVIEPGVILAVQKQPQANTLELTRELDAVLADLETSLPEGMHVHSDLFRQATFIEHSVANTTTALVEGGLMVLLVVVAFLASARASLITLLAIPISLLATICVLRAGGATINTMTLGGMAIAIGALVDDAIIDVENVIRRLRLNAARAPAERATALRVVFDASVEVRASIVFATFIILVVFAPLFFLDGVEGRLLRPLGIAFCISLGASLLTALTVTPALCVGLLPASRTVARAGDTRLVGALKRAYDRPLAWAMAHPLALAVPAALLGVAALVGVARMGRNFLPEFHEGALVIGTVTAPGTSLDESDALARRVERALMAHPEVVAVGRRTGRAERDEHVLGVEASEFEVTLDMEAARRLGHPRRSAGELVEVLRADLAAVGGFSATFGQPIGHRIDHMLSGTRANVAVKVFGDDLPTLRGIAAQVEGLLAAIPGVVDLATESQADIPQTRVDFDRDALARHGLRVADAARAMEAAAKGVAVTRVIEGTAAYDLTVRLADAAAPLPHEVGEIGIDTPAGGRIPLRAVAEVSDDRGPNFIMRENVQRRIVVSCNVAGRDMTGVVEDAREAVDEMIDLPPGYHVEYGGQFESAQATARRLSLLGALAVIAIGFLLRTTLGSGRDALLVMVNLPLALIGGVVGIVVCGGALSVASIIGLISLFGIAARNGILLVSHVRHLHEHEGVGDFAEAVRRGAQERLAPILMTALASGLALVPIALRGDEPGTEILTPMAIVILFGLCSSTTLNMLIVPGLLLRFAGPRPAPNAPDLRADGAGEALA
ncbi:MAG: efflux RND transporter permease subunit [Planctomycetota bacterium]|nr:efflux RND transporter permease subunit [Planctomycetota bacterium]